MRFFRKDLEVLSLFQDFPFDTITIEQSKSTCIIDIIQPFLSHIRDIICGKNLDYYSYIISWISYLIQNPRAKNEPSIVIIRDQVQESFYSMGKSEEKSESYWWEISQSDLNHLLTKEHLSCFIC
ncbi:MAG: hypothetical protein Ta2E_01400 [Mycoplasmoidaceae bacterium]|nr:MAG: hypothetical protein Ta2E_01400 [Mycoplasmoidaceae bacterium]